MIALIMALKYMRFYQLYYETLLLVATIRLFCFSNYIIKINNKIHTIIQYNIIY